VDRLNILTTIFGNSAQIFQDFRQEISFFPPVQRKMDTEQQDRKKKFLTALLFCAQNS